MKEFSLAIYRMNWLFDKKISMDSSYLDGSSVDAFSRELERLGYLTIIPRGPGMIYRLTERGEAFMADVRKRQERVQDEMFLQLYETGNIGSEEDSDVEW